MQLEIRSGVGRVAQVRAVRADAFTIAKRQSFLDSLSATCNVRLSARAAGVDETTPYRLRGRDPAFAEALRAALATGCERLEEALLEYAMARVAGEVADPAAADPDAVAQSAPGELAMRTISPTDLQFATALVARYRATLDGTGKRSVSTRHAPATTEQTDAVLRSKLDKLARKLKAQA